MRGSSRRVAGLLAGVLSVALLAPAAVAEESAPSTPSGPAAPVLPALPVTGSTAPAPTAKGVRAQVGAIVDARGLGLSAAIVLDPTDGKVLLDVRGDQALVPGSVVKLATAAAALAVLGPEARIATTVVGDDSRTITLVGGGDATLTMGGGPQGTASLADLAKQVANQVQAGPVDLRYDDSLFTGPRLGPGWGRDYPSVGGAAPVTALMVDQGRVRPGSLARVKDPALDAAQKFRKLLKANGVKVRSLKPGSSPDKGTEIARVESAPMATLVERMLTDSDNDLAEALSHLAGGAAGFKASFAGGAKAATKTLEGLGLPVAGMRLADGSGVSSDNRVSAMTLASLLALVATGSRPELGPIASGLAVAGFSGTLAERFTGQERKAAGYVRAKTGTLTGVTSLAGLVPDTSGRMLAFALLANDIASIERARSLGDEFAAGLAACGCR